MSDSEKGTPDAEQTVIRRREDFNPEATLADRVMGRVKGKGAKPAGGKPEGNQPTGGKGPQGAPQSGGQPGGGASGGQSGGGQPNNPFTGKPTPQNAGGAAPKAPQSSGAAGNGAKGQSGNAPQGQAGNAPKGQPGDAPKGQPGDGAKGQAGNAPKGEAGNAGRPGQQQTHTGGPKPGETKPADPKSGDRVRTGEAAQGVPAPKNSDATPEAEGKSGDRVPAKVGLAAAAGVATGRAKADDADASGDKVRQVSRSRRTRKARLRVAVVDPWPVMKTAFLFSIAAAIVVLVATAVIYGVLAASGLFEQINTIVAPFLQAPGDAPFDITVYIDFKRVMGGAVLLAAFNVAIITALATLGAFLYNLASALNGGLEVTLAEE